MPGSLTDVDGLLVGHHQRLGRGWRTGTTAIIAPAGAVAGVDVRGGGPGTRETDLLAPQAMIERIHGICLTGGSAYGLAAADGVMQWLEEQHIGFPVLGGQQPEWVVPIVPAAVIFDLGRGGVFGNRPDAGFGHRAASAARRSPERVGAVGAGTGARAGGLQGGVGSASRRLADGTTVAALAVVNAVGQVIDPSTALPWHLGDLRLKRPTRAERQALAEHVATVIPPLNTTIGIVATDAALTKAECTKLAAVAHDGLARAIRPAHLMFDGDTIFGLSTERRPLLADGAPSRPSALNALLIAAADCFAEACTSAVVNARSSPGGAPSYRDLCPTAFA